MRYRNDLIKWRLKAVEKTRDEYAREAGLSTNTIDRVLRGENVSVDILTSAANPLDLNMKSLFDFDLTIEHASRAVKA
jgi:transcriptional regulator with XRE-family HTH domain